MPPKTNSNDFSAQLQKGIEEINKNIDIKLEEHRKSGETHLSQVIGDFEVKFNELMKKMQQDFAAEISKIKSDVNHCYEFIKQIDKNTTNKFLELEKSQNVLMRRLNRPDIILTGVPKGSPDLVAIVLKIAEIYGIALGVQDISQCLSIKNNREILVKFNSIITRDSIMKKYFETRSLQLKDVVEMQSPGSDIEGRIYLSDHLTPMASKLCYICRKLKREKRITEFKFRNGDIPRATLKKSDGAELTLDVFNIMEKYQEFASS